MLTPITYKEYCERVEALRSPYWRSTKEARWLYISAAIQAAHGANTAIEIGSARMPIFHGSDTIDMEPGYDPRSGGRFLCFDARKTPWAVGHYDVAVILQTMEHLQPNQAEVGAELLRVADRVVMSVPYKNPKGSTYDCHADIDETVIRGWFGREPSSSVIIPHPGQPSHSRILCVYR